MKDSRMSLITRQAIILESGINFDSFIQDEKMRIPSSCIEKNTDSVGDSPTEIG